MIVWERWQKEISMLVENNKQWQPLATAAKGIGKEI